MPPKTKFSSEQIVDIAFALVREKGSVALTARELAARLGTSTRPIFTHFKTMDELAAAVEVKAKELYDEYIETGLSSARSFKGYGLYLLKFVKDEPELFEMLFLKQKNDESFDDLLVREGHRAEGIKAILWTFDVDEEQANWLFNNLMLYAHGIATMIRMNAYHFSDEQLDGMLGQMAQRMVTGMKAEGDPKYDFLNPEVRKKFQEENK